MGRKVWTTIAPTGQGGDKKARGRSTAAKIWKNFSRRAIAQGAREILEEVEDEIHAPSMKKSTVTKKTQVAPFNGVGYGKDTTATSKPAKIPSSEKPKTNETTEKPKVGFYTFNALPKVVTKQIRFESFLRKYMPNFSDKQWKTQNMVQHAPSGLSKHVSDSILVFDFRDDVRGCFLLGATMFRMTNYSKCRMPYEQKARAILQIDSGTGTIVGRWTDWQPNTSTSRTRPGIYTHMVQKLGYRVSQIFQNQGAFQKAYKMGKIDSKYESEVCMFEETDSSFLKPLAKEG